MLTVAADTSFITPTKQLTLYKDLTRQAFSARIVVI